MLVERIYITFYKYIITHFNNFQTRLRGKVSYQIGNSIMKAYNYLHFDILLPIGYDFHLKSTIGFSGKI